MLIKESWVLAYCMGVNSGSIFIEGYNVALAEWQFWVSCFTCTFIVRIERGKLLEISWAVRTGQVVKLPLLIAEMKVDLVGQSAAV